LQLQPPHNPPKKVAGTAKDRPPNSRKGSDAMVNDRKVNDRQDCDLKANAPTVNVLRALLAVNAKV